VKSRILLLLKKAQLVPGGQTIHGSIFYRQHNVLTLPGSAVPILERSLRTKFLFFTVVGKSSMDVNRNLSQGGFMLFVSTGSARNEVDSNNQNMLMIYSRSMIIVGIKAGDSVVCGSATSSADLVWGRISARSRNWSAFPKPLSTPALRKCGVTIDRSICLATRRCNGATIRDRLDKRIPPVG
jgi:hypothetical protein